HCSVSEVEEASRSVNEGKGKCNEGIGAASNETVEKELHGLTPPKVNKSDTVAQ
ncbi:MAG: hypothetical protein RUDDFDWM_001287, partial [Candidatus Fervidibacterota bacterium]